MSKKSVAEQKFNNWILMMAISSELPRWHNSRIGKSELTIESIERLQNIMEDTKHILELMLIKRAIKIGKKLK